MTTRTKSIAVVAFAAALGVVMFVFTPSDAPMPVSTAVFVTPDPVPIASSPSPRLVAPAPFAELPEPQLEFEPDVEPLRVAPLTNLPPMRTARSATLAPHVYCSPDRVGESVYDALSTRTVPCSSSSPIIGREYHSDPSGEFLIEHSPIRVLMGQVTALAETTPTCERMIDFTPPVLLYPPHNRQFTHITVSIDGVDYGKRDVVKLSREVWRTTVPSQCDTPALMRIVIDFWPNQRSDDPRYVPLRIAATIQGIEVKP